MTNNFVPLIGVGSNRDYGGHRYDPPDRKLLEIADVQPDIGPFAHQRAFQEQTDMRINVLTKVGDTSLGANTNGELS